ncbi:MAG: tetratricopeptide repeat protein [Puniceicoccales bacterium]|jgi:hypothetical protein|nr:tetratricopeptide repeat protein [Puniceicoccales bacterium]
MDNESESLPFLFSVFHASFGIVGVLFLVFSLWMIIHAIWKQEWIWLVILLIFPAISPILYFFMVYVQASGHGFELPGASNRRRIKELQTKIHNLDKAVFHAQLGDIYFEQGKFAKAETCYRAALERDSDDIDTQSHLGQSLLRQGKTQEALTMLKSVVSVDPRHEYGYTMMAYAEALGSIGQKAEARAAWEKVVAANTYARARVQLAELLIGEGKQADARPLLDETIADAAHTPKFQRQRESVWVRKAKRLRRKT